MSEELNGKKSKLIGKLSIAKLEKQKVWKDYQAKSKVAAEANSAHEQAKEAMRVFLKQTLQLEDDVVIDFSKNSDGTLTITEKLEKKVKRTAGSNLLDDKF